MTKETVRQAVPVASTTGRLAGKVAVVTGAGSGIGAATAMGLAAAGAWVACTDVNADGLARTVGIIVERGGVAIGHAGDVTSEDDVGAVVERAVAAYSRIDVLFANAGISGEGRAHETTVELWERVIAVNLTGVWLSSRAVLPVMMRAGTGSIILLASIAGLVGRPAAAAYSSAKAGLIGLTRQMSVDYGPYGIRVNAICPGTIDTPLARQSYADRGALDLANPQPGLARMGQDYPLTRLGNVDDVSGAVVFLASDESAWMSGSVLVVDGGLTATRPTGLGGFETPIERTR